MRPDSMASVCPGVSPALESTSRHEMPAAERARFSISPSSMASKIATRILVASQEGIDCRSHPRETAAVKTFRERLAWIREHRGFRSDRELSLSAGLSAATLGNAARAEAKTGLLNIDSTTAAKAATTGRVSVHWLLTGNGSPEMTPDDESPTSPHPGATSGVVPSARPEWVRMVNEVIAALTEAGVPPKRAEELAGQALVKARENPNAARVALLALEIWKQEGIREPSPELANEIRDRARDIMQTGADAGRANQSKGAKHRKR